MIDAHDDAVELELTPKLKQNQIVSNFAIRRTYQYDNSPYSAAAITDDLTYHLSSTYGLSINDNTGQIHITHKYYDRAEFVLYRINIWDPSAPPPIFVINCSDIPPALQKELEQLKESDPRLFDRVVTDAIQSLMEGINDRYYHVSGVAYKISWRFDP